VDAGGVDSGPVDAGTNDAGFDAGPLDAGFDAGFDAGPLVDAGDPCAQGTFLDMTCQTGPTDSAACNLTLLSADAGVAGAESCFSCGALARRERLYSFDFGAVGNCDLGNWQLQTGNVCNDSIDRDCTLGGASDKGCCDVEAEVCAGVAQEGGVVRADKATCTTGQKEQAWLQQTFDLSGYANGIICVRHTETGADHRDGVFIEASDGSNGPDVALCRMGDITGDGEWIESCGALPSWTDDNANVQIDMRLHSENNGHLIRVSEVWLAADPLACASDRQVFDVDELTGCGEGTDGAASIDGWTVIAGDVICDRTWSGCTDADAPIVSDSTTLTIEGTLNSVGIGSDPTLCLELGDKGAGGGEQLRVSVDSGNGFQVVGYRDDDIGDGPDDTCVPTCFDLSGVQPSARNLPDLAVHIELISNDREVGVDRVWLEGRPRCDAVSVGAATVSAVTAGGLAGEYDVSVDATSSVLSVDMSCTVPDVSLVRSNVVRLNPNP
jgi:hypothetical protein